MKSSQLTAYFLSMLLLLNQGTPSFWPAAEGDRQFSPAKHLPEFVAGAKPPLTEWRRLSGSDEGLKGVLPVQTCASPGAGEHRGGRIASGASRLPVRPRLYLLFHAFLFYEI